MIATLADVDFTCDERRSDSPFVDIVWHSRSEALVPFLSIAQPRWNMVISRVKGQTTLTVRGPETMATPAVSPPDADFVGILFKLGTLMPLFPAAMVMDRADITLPNTAGRAFWLDSRAWQFPDYENADTFVDRLAREGLVRYDPVVADALKGRPVDLSQRGVQRRFKQATGVTHGTVEQIQRARYALRLIKRGAPVLDVVHGAGYADQPHLIRSLKRFIGLTPQQILTPDRSRALSFLFNTDGD